MLPSDSTEENKRVAREAISRIEALLHNEDFRWFMAHVLEQARDEERAAALNTAKPIMERDQACWRHALADQLCRAPETLRQMHARTAGIKLD